MGNVWGPAMIGTQIETGALALISAWMPNALEDIEIQMGRTPGQIPAPKTYTTRNEFTSFPNDILPLCVAASPGLVDQPTKEADGTYSAWWALGIGFAAVARDVEAAAFLSKTYAAAARTILLWRQSLGGVATKVIWVDESYDDLVTEDDRSIRAAYDVYRVHSYGVAQEYSGPPAGAVPTDPISQAGATWGEAEIVSVTNINILET